MTTSPLTIADQGFFWVGVTRRQQGYGLTAPGPMYVQYQIPAERRHRYPLIMVHGGGGQGLDYLGTPDGRPGWATWFLRQGYAVYVVDRPGLGRSPYHADLLGPMTPPPTYEQIVGLFSAPRKAARYPQAERHTQWPGSGEVGDPAVDQFMAGSGPMMADLARTQAEMQRCGVELLDRIGPAIVMCHSMGGPFGWLVADQRPDLVKAILAIEPVGPPFFAMPGGGSLAYGITAIPLAYDPPVNRPEDLTRVLRKAPGADLLDCFVQAEPARKLPRLAGIPIGVVVAEASWMAQFTHGTADWLVQAGADAELIRLENLGIRGNGHLMMGETNSDEVAAALHRWIIERVAA